MAALVDGGGRERTMENGMATRIEVKPSLYEQDVYAWSRTTLTRF
jgi:hypothetical protein